MTERPDVTIVVCTYNRATRLRAALASLARLELDGRTAEILVVDNNSTDDTPAAVREVAATSPIAVRSVRETEQGIVPARNRGVAEARGEWIAFFDDDQLAEPNWIATLLELAERRDAKCVGGAVHLRMPEGVAVPSSPVVRMLLGESVGMGRERRYNRRVTPGCGNLMIRRDVFDRVGGFDPEYASRGEDTELWLRIDDAGLAGWYTPHAVVEHVIPPERLEPAFLRRLAGVMSEGMAEDEHATWGGWYPLVWLARVAQAALVLWPQLVWARLTRNDDAALGAQCRLDIATRCLRNGWKLMTTRSSSRPRRADERLAPTVREGLAASNAGKALPHGRG